jgi:hypothetical protein
LNPHDPLCLLHDYENWNVPSDGLFCFLQLIFGRRVLQAHGLRQSIGRDELPNQGRGHMGELYFSFIIWRRYIFAIQRHANKSRVLHGNVLGELFGILQG